LGGSGGVPLMKECKKKVLQEGLEIRQILFHPTERGYFFRQVNFLLIAWFILFFGIFFIRSIFTERAQKNYCAANSKHDDDEPDSGVVLKNVEIHMLRPPSLLSDNLLRHLNELNVMFLISHLLSCICFLQ
jgi:hypothetical protein